MENQEKKLYMILKVVIVTLSVYFLFKYMLPAAAPFVIAYGLCRWIYPFVVKIHKKTKIPEGTVAVVLLSSGTLAVLFIVYFAVRYLFGQMERMIVNTDQMLLLLQDMYTDICSAIGRIFRCDTSRVFQWFAVFGEKISESIHVWIMNFMATIGVSLIKSMAMFLMIVIIALVAAVLLIKNKRQIDRQLRKNTFSIEISEISARVWSAAGCFLKSQVIIILIISAICSAGIYIAGGSYAIVTGIVTGLLDALPVFGSGTVLVPWAVISLLMGNYRKGILLFIVYIICAFVREVLEARLMGNYLGINEFYMLIATFAGIYLLGVSGIILGPLGMILILEILRQIRLQQKIIK